LRLGVYDSIRIVKVAEFLGNLKGLIRDR
jgi:hypothetical protein